MAKNNRFPSDANKKATPAAKQEIFPVVKGEPQELVQIHYKKKNHHILSPYSHLSEGLNQIPAKSWEEHKKHPSVQQLLKDGHAVELSGASEPEVKEVEKGEPQESEGSDDSEE